MIGPTDLFHPSRETTFKNFPGVFDILESFEMWCWKRISHFLQDRVQGRDARHRYRNCLMQFGFVVGIVLGS
jgi:hypothetical protein